MAVQVLPNRYAGIGNALKGLGSGLDQLAQSKLADLQRQYYPALERQRYGEGVAKLFENRLGPDKAKQIGQVLSNLGEKERAQLLKNPAGLMELLGGGQGQQGQQQTGLAGMQQQGMGQDQGGQQDPYAALRQAFESPQERHNRAMEDIGRDKNAIAQQDKLRPYMTALADYNSKSNQAASVAKSMLANIEKNKKKFPGLFKGNLPPHLQANIINDKDVRKYIQESNKLLDITANSDKGRGILTNMKLKLKELGKVNVGQPVETQIAILKDIIKEAGDTNELQRYTSKLKNKHGGFPGDISDKIADFWRAKEDPLGSPELFDEGTVAMFPDGIERAMIKGKWEPTKGKG